MMKLVHDAVFKFDVKSSRLICIFIFQGSCAQPLDSKHHFKSTSSCSKFCEVSGSPLRLSTYPQKKQPEHNAANQVEGLSNDLVRLLALHREQGSNRYSRLRAYYKGFDLKLTYYNYLNQKLWKSQSKFNPMPGSWALTYPSKASMPA